MKRKSIILGIAFTAIMITLVGINVHLVLIAADNPSDVSLNKIEALSSEGDQDIANDANNASGLLWEKYTYNCTYSRYRVTRNCGEFSIGMIIYSIPLASQLQSCGGDGYSLK
ncbi:MAG: hypothetical protein LBD59_11945 [Prevotellaceae bacterium]|jgi:hypothetical protein|nr:hypothetical protein [Prevotellaceae bacterium]